MSMSKEHRRDAQKREGEEQREPTKPQPIDTLPPLDHQLLMKLSTTIHSNVIGSESEENNSMVTTTAAMPSHKLLQQQNSSLSNSNNSTSFSIFSSRVEDEDPIFCLDEEVQAKEVSGERTRHYTADFDPTISDDDEFPKEVDNLHGGRAYSASNRFPPRIRHSGRSGQLHTTTGIHYNKVSHGLHEGVGPLHMVPASLPIQISRGFNWPPRELVGSLSEEEDSAGGAEHSKAMNKITGGGNERGRAKTTTIPPINDEEDREGAVDIGQQQHGSEREDMYGRIQAYSRSIQPEDDPERIFGERPHRRCSFAVKYATFDGSDASIEHPGGSAEEDNSGGENIPPGANPHHQQQMISSPTGGDSGGGLTNGSSTTTTTTVGTPRVVMPASLLRS